MPNILKILFSPTGRMGRRDFLIGLVAMIVATTVFNFVLGRLGNSVWAFLISLPFPFIVLHMTYSVYGKRLHDMGRSFWPLTAMIVALICVAIGVMMAYGGAEYFSDFAAYDRKAPPSDDVAAGIKAKYEARLADGLPIMNGLMLGIIGSFTLWLGLTKPQAAANNYGSPPAP